MSPQLESYDKKSLRALTDCPTSESAQDWLEESKGMQQNAQSRRGSQAELKLAVIRACATGSSLRPFHREDHLQSERVESAGKNQIIR